MSRTPERAQTNEDVTDLVDGLAAEWKFLTKEQRSERIAPLREKVGSRRRLADMLGMSEGALRRYETPPDRKAKLVSTLPRNKPIERQIGSRSAKQRDNEGSRKAEVTMDSEERLAAVLIDFFAGRYGVPDVVRKNALEVAIQAQASIAREGLPPILIPPRRIVLAPAASSEDIIRATAPSREFSSQFSLCCDWMGSILLSMGGTPQEHRSAIARALEIHRNNS